MGACGANIAHIVHQRPDLFRANIARTLVENLIQIFLIKGICLHAAEKTGRVDRNSVVGDRRAGTDQTVCPLRVTRTHHGIGIHEDLGADLLGNHRAVQRHAAALGCGNAFLQAKVSGVLCRISKAAPPEDGLVLDDVIEPGFTDLPRGDLSGKVRILHRAEKTKGTGQIIIRHDQRQIQLLMNVVIYIRKTAADLLIRPALHRASQINADHLAQNTGVYFLTIFRRNFHGITPSRNH